MAVTPDIPVTWTGVSLSVLVPSPSWLELFLPHDQTVAVRLQNYAVEASGSNVYPIYQPVHLCRSGPGIYSSIAQFVTEVPAPRPDSAIRLEAA